MKEFIVEFTETVTYKTIIEAESIDDAEEKFMNGDFNDCQEIDRVFESVCNIEEV